MERSIQTTFHAMLPPKPIDRRRQNQNIQSFNVGDKVVIKSYLGKNQWEPGVIEKIIGNVLYKVRGAFGIQIRHTNQILREKSTLETVGRQVNFPVKIITDTPMKGTLWDTHSRWGHQESWKVVIKLQIDLKKKAH